MGHQHSFTAMFAEDSAKDAKEILKQLPKLSHALFCEPRTDCCWAVVTRRIHHFAGYGLVSRVRELNTSNFPSGHAVSFM